MDTQMVFRRYEQKYFLTREQKELLLRAAGPRLRPEEYGRTTVRNVYFDTGDFRLIRRSLEKPVYKEKLRLRSYRKTPPGGEVFVELKKKYRKVVFKRRVLLPERAAANWLCGCQRGPLDTQIAREIEYFRDYHGPLRPVLFLAYERESYYGLEGGDLRMTFDENIRARRTGLSTGAHAAAEPLLAEGAVLMELKTAGAIPLWLARLLSEQQLFCTPFSKYGMAYQKIVFPKGGCLHDKSCLSGDF